MKVKVSNFLILLLIVYIIGLSFYAYHEWQINQGLKNKEIITNSEQKEKILIGFAMGTLKEERWLSDRDILMAKVKELGADIIVQNANNDDQDQIKQVKYLLEQGIDLLIIVPNDLAKAAQAVKLAKDKGVPVISYDRLVWNADIDLYISFDNQKVGELMAEAITQNSASGDILIINGPLTDNNVHMIKEGYEKVLNSKENLNRFVITKEYFADNWLKEYAYKVTNEYLQRNRPPVAIIAGNDSLAGGVINALAERRLAGKVKVVGQDADLLACQRIVKGTQLMTVYKPIDRLAELTAKTAIRMAKGEKITTEQVINNGYKDVNYLVLQPQAVTKENLYDTVIKDGFHSQEEIYLK